MYFSLKTLLPTVAALVLLKGVVAAPVFDDLVERNDFDDASLLERDAVLDAVLEARMDDILHEIDSAAGKHKYTHGPTRLSISDNAKAELNRLNIHGKERKNAIKWNKNKVKKEMRKNPELKGAHTGVIEHLAHKGGSQPKEKNHITASFKDKHGQQIHNSYNGGPNHHLYINKNNAGAGRQAKGGYKKNNNEIKGKNTGHKSAVNRNPESRHGKSSQKNGGKGKGQQRQGGASKNQNKGPQVKKGGRK
ncbi:hypothetical protein JR316_0005983 [Psilocybe cubensis]|uniref:Uncharacterized protein n=1 Tax=Psilocybe cubensis TaxID=181762 RepID=A0ACB8H1A1_PSICU|nr:hypothetical protein JR316_0005983 [Psilocybe cubensis]KAH9481457.1 hypothetical protein JR316_0005983 [Psilocybe cubensis]